jgi:hypothetical protein
VSGLTAAWLAGMGIVSWREVHGNGGHLPVPGALIGVTGLFAVLALLGDVSPRARPVLTLAAWGLDVAGLLNVLPAGLFAQSQQAAQTTAQAEGLAAPATRDEAV